MDCAVHQHGNTGHAFRGGAQTDDSVVLYDDKPLHRSLDWIGLCFKDNWMNLPGVSKEVMVAAQNIRDDCADQLMNTYGDEVDDAHASRSGWCVQWKKKFHIRDPTDSVKAEDIINSHLLTYESLKSVEEKAKLTSNIFIKVPSRNQRCGHGHRHIRRWFLAFKTVGHRD